jgi:hypothetical protein
MHNSPVSREPFDETRVTFSHAEVCRMADLLPNQSKESVMEALGVSSNTWLKIKRGEPIRTSTARMLKRRLA